MNQNVTMHVLLCFFKTYATSTFKTIAEQSSSNDTAMWIRKSVHWEPDIALNVYLVKRYRKISNCILKS